MGTHGRTGLERIRLGSVAESILRQASVPVLTVGPQVTSSGSSGRFEKILCPVNFGHLARAACEFAAGLAERTGAELIVTHVVEGEQPSPERVHRELCDWIGPDIRQRCRVNEVVREGSAAEQIVALARESKADMVVAGARPRSLLGAVLFGSTSESLIRTAPCPVLSVIRK
jgi:nucleotide-binding universal stress UspA family protein